MKSPIINRIKEGVASKTGQVFDRVEKGDTKKLTIALLSVFALGVFGLGYLQIRYYLDQPFFSDRLAEEKALIRGPKELYDFLLLQQRNKSEIATLQQRDSDADGLSDYQEEFIYKTDIYNPDTDEDGVNDGNEVNAGADPKCPADTDCTLENIFSPSGSATTTQQYEVPAAVTENTTITSPQAKLFEQLKQQLPPDDLVALKSYFQSLTIEELRQQFILQGLTQEQVDAISDEDLKKIVDELANSLE